MSPAVISMFQGVRNHTPGLQGIIQAALIVGAIYALIGRDVDALAAQVAVQGEKIELLERRVLGSYERNGGMYARRQCLAMKRENVPIFPGECDHVFAEIESKIDEQLDQ